MQRHTNTNFFFSKIYALKSKIRRLQIYFFAASYEYELFFLKYSYALKSDAYKYIYIFCSVSKTDFFLIYALKSNVCIFFFFFFFSVSKTDFFFLIYALKSDVHKYFLYGNCTNTNSFFSKTYALKSDVYKYLYEHFFSKTYTLKSSAYKYIFFCSVSKTGTPFSAVPATRRRPPRPGAWCARGPPTSAPISTTARPRAASVRIRPWGPWGVNFYFLFYIRPWG